MASHAAPHRVEYFEQGECAAAAEEDHPYVLILICAVRERAEAPVAMAAIAHPAEFDPYSDLWKDVEPIPQDDGPNPVVPIAYEPECELPWLCMSSALPRDFAPFWFAIFFFFLP